MTYSLKRGALLLPILAPVLLAGCVSQADYDALQTQNTSLQTQNQQLQQQLSAEQTHVNRLQEAVRYTVNSDLLFPSGGYQLSPAGKSIIGKIASKLAADQHDKLIVSGYTDNAPIGPALRRQGISSNEVLSEKRAGAVMQYMISRGVKPELVTAKGFGDMQPVASNNTSQGRAQNRRVEVSIATPTPAPVAAPTQEPAPLPETPTPCPPGSGGCG